MGLTADIRRNPSPQTFGTQADDVNDTMKHSG
jgi:hypothetical protein